MADKPEEPEPPPDASATALGASLNEVLDDLEQMLHTRRGPEETQAPAAEGGDDPYCIPLLDEVIEVGPAAPASTRIRPTDPAAADFRRRVVERLASEIEVIVHSRVERALASAAEDIRKQVREHIAIILPEILDELREQDRDPRRDVEEQ
jgi:hypothetical protein